MNMHGGFVKAEKQAHDLIDRFEVDGLFFLEALDFVVEFMEDCIRGTITKVYYYCHDGEINWAVEIFRAIPLRNEIVIPRKIAVPDFSFCRLSFTVFDFSRFSSCV